MTESPTFSFTGVSQPATGPADTSLDDLAASLAGSFNVSSEPNNPSAPHPRFSQYKSRYSSMDQRERRLATLLQQKEKRLETVNLVRRLAENTWKEEKMEAGSAEDKQEPEAMDVCETRTRKPGKHYRNQLMMSEWMLDIPDDFETEWVMVPCPVGRRSLVIASMGETSQYTKSGYRLSRFASALPGGRKGAELRSQDCTILDTVYSEVNNTFYILDMMCWKQMPFYDSDTEFRMYWLHTKFQEHPELQEQGRKNPYRFEPLPNFSCCRENIAKVMAAKMNFELDGLLFYHKKTHYTFGATPLVLWLKPYMLTELLGVSVLPDYFSNIPSHYKGFDKHRENVQHDKAEAEKKRELVKSGETTPGGGKKQKGKRGQTKMEVSSDAQS